MSHQAMGYMTPSNQLNNSRPPSYLIHEAAPGEPRKYRKLRQRFSKTMKKWFSTNLTSTDSVAGRVYCLKPSLPLMVTHGNEVIYAARRLQVEMVAPILWVKLAAKNERVTSLHGNSTFGICILKLNRTISFDIKN